HEPRQVPHPPGPVEPHSDQEDDEVAVEGRAVAPREDLGHAPTLSASGHTRKRMSVVAIFVIVFAVLFIVLFVGGLAGARQRAKADEEQLHDRVAAADRALEAARAADRGWD